jgi:hypothetical protein
MPTKQFIGFKSKKQLVLHIKREFPKCKIGRIGKKRILKGATKTTPPATSYMVSLKGCK